MSAVEASAGRETFTLPPAEIPGREITISHGDVVSKWRAVEIEVDDIDRPDEAPTRYMTWELLETSAEATV